MPEDFYRYIAELCHERDKATASRARQAYEDALSAVQDRKVTSSLVFSLPLFFFFFFWGGVLIFSKTELL